ncbi:hypothetical protein FG05_35238 [Fusarium graminearum]|nr:hypothetical protein FG05_35238 [Fusarium graminearum]
MPFVCHFVEFLCLFEFGCCSEACASPALSTSYSTPVVYLSFCVWLGLGQLNPGAWFLGRDSPASVV